jgi:hypothetical protein
MSIAVPLAAAAELCALIDEEAGKFGVEAPPVAFVLIVRKKAVNIDCADSMGSRIL